MTSQTWTTDREHAEALAQAITAEAIPTLRATVWTGVHEIRVSLRDNRGDRGYITVRPDGTTVDQTRGYSALVSLATRAVMRGGA